jgi:hypothetical protein
VSHDYHEQLHGYDPAQILVDNCGECEARSEYSDHGISSLDSDRFEAAWKRAAAWFRAGGVWEEVSDAEVPLLAVLWSVQVQLERLGVPLGTVPLPEPHLAMRRPA